MLILPAKEALQMGLINVVFPNNKLEGEVRLWVQRTMMLSPMAFVVAKAAIDTAQDGSAWILLTRGHTT